jgi:alpha-aminoadipic semialdehyde synthase
MRGNRTVGMVREVYSKWERRSPFTPENVKNLVQQGLRVLVQPCNKRVFADWEYEAAGAELVDDLEPACTIFGVKQVPIENLIPDRTYVFFSHVIKAQPENMALLDALLEKNVRLIDYECICSGGERTAPRLVAFGKYAGKAGMINSFRGLGERLLALGYSTPFLNMHAAYQYNSLDHACSAVQDVGRRLLNSQSTAAFSPLTFVFTGNGNCSQGAQEVFAELGDAHAFVKPEELPDLVEAGRRGELDPSKVYGCVADADAMVTPKDPTRPFEMRDYFSHPERYDPVFHSDIAPYASVLVNCGYWDARYPRLITIDQQRAMIEEGRSRLLVVGDVSCDIGGSVEFLAQDTQIEQPFFLYDFDVNHTNNSTATAGDQQAQAQAPRFEGGRGGVAPYALENMDDPNLSQVLMMGVDILPSELPREASAHFGAAMLPFVPALAASDGALPHSDQVDRTSTSSAGAGAGETAAAAAFGSEADEATIVAAADGRIPPELWGGIVCAHGKLTPPFEYITGMRAARERTERQQAAFLSATQQRQVEGSAVLNLQGHLFDAGLINQVLDLIEEEDGRFDILECNARPNANLGADRANHSNALLQVTFDGGREHLDQVIERLQVLVTSMPKADGEIEEIKDFCKGDFGRTMRLEA